MKLKDYIEKHKEELEKNPNVSKVGKTIQYAPEFKIKAVEMHRKGYANRLIFEENGLPYTNKSKNYIYVWTKQYDESGKESFFKENRGRNINRLAGRPKKEKELTSDEKVLIQEKQIEALRKENEELKKEFRLGKEVKINGNEFNVKPTHDIFCYIYELKDKVKVSIESLCKYFEVSRSGYYKWVKTIPLKQQREEQDYSDFLIIKKTWLKHKKKHGYLRINMDLKHDEGIIMNPKKIYRLMKKYGIQAEIRKVTPYLGIKKATKEHNYFENKLDRQFDVKEPDTVFVTDITYLIFGNQRYYLSVVKELCTREVVAWKLSNGLGINLSLDVIDQLVKKYGKKKLKNVMIHSDQGVHYTSPMYINKLKEINIIQSMSRRGNCIDNAKMETFFGHFKDECDYRQAKNISELYIIVDNYMKYYNRKRYQWTLNKMAPTQYRNHLKAA